MTEIDRDKELSCVRALLERILRVMDEGLFVDYQMEKYGRIGYKVLPSKQLFCCDVEDCKWYNERVCVSLYIKIRNDKTCLTYEHKHNL